LSSILLQRLLRFRYSLRALLVFITLFALWGGYHANRSWQERNAVEVLRLHGGRFLQRGHYGGLDPLTQAGEYYRQLIQFIWGQPCICIAEISAELEPDVVDALRRLPYLEMLTLRAPSCGRLDRTTREALPCPLSQPPAGALKRLLRKRNLHNLKLDHWILSDDDVRAIRKHKYLTVLYLESVTMSEDAFATLFGLPHLHNLYLQDCPITGNKLADAPASTSLRSFHSEHTPLAKEFALYVARLRRIEDLNLRGSAIDDSFVDALGGHPTLLSTALYETSISPRAIRVLEEMPLLHSVHLPSHLEGHPAVDRVESARPKLSIRFQ
jgi:hypothetical protein